MGHLTGEATRLAGKVLEGSPEDDGLPTTYLLAQAIKHLANQCDVLLHALNSTNFTVAHNERKRIGELR